MPTFKVISVEIYNEMIKELQESVLEFFSCKYKSSFVRCITLLYECCQVKSYLITSNNTYSENASVNIKHIKQFVNDPNYNYIINILMGIRNSLGHGYLSAEVLNDCSALISDDMFKSFLEKMEFPVDVIQMFIDEESPEFRTCNHRDYEELNSADFFREL